MSTSKNDFVAVLKSLRPLPDKWNVYWKNTLSKGGYKRSTSPRNRSVCKKRQKSPFKRW